MVFNRRQFIRSSSLALTGVAIAGVPAWPHGMQAPPVTKFEELRRGVGIFTGRGGTIGYLINGDGAVAVDSQYMDTARVCVAGLSDRTPKGIPILINTHHHADHTGGNMAFDPAVQRIVAHENCVTWHKRVAEEAGNVSEQAFAGTTFADTWSVDFGDETIHARHMGPGHTSGDAVVVFENANVVHGGDLLWWHVHPFIDRPAGASIAHWIAILDQMATAYAGDTLFVFGHGKDGVVQGAGADVSYFRDYLAAVLDHAARGVKAGQSRDEVTRLPTLPGFDDMSALSARLSLAAVLGVGYDEAASR